MHNTPSFPSASLLNKVPEITLGFWLIKIMTTTVGETIADYLAVNAGFGKAATRWGMLTLLLLALVAQMRAHRCRPALYWWCVVLVSVVGTQITDALTDDIGISLYASTGAFLALLVLCFVLWFRSEKTLSIQSINTPQREAYYWLTILCTFALGTAAGDLATEALGLGFQVGVGVFGGLIALTALARRMGTPAVLAFWLVYILTRPLGAALGDWLSQAREYGGLGFGAQWTSVVFLCAIGVLVARTQRGAATPQALSLP
jgi:uncharacterized membrane-anchored protein